MTAYGEQYGKLTEKTHRQKWVDEWTFYAPMKGSAPYKVRIRLRNEYNKGLTFVAICDQLRPPLVDSDINKLHKRVAEALRRQDMDMHNMKWENWLEVEIENDPHSWKDEDRFGLSIIVRPLKRAVNPENGQAYTINNNSVVVPFPEPKRAGVEDKNVHEEEWFHAREEAHQFAYIPATPANKAALKALRERITEAHGRLCAILAQDTIQGTLENTAHLRLEGPK